MSVNQRTSFLNKKIGPAAILQNLFSSWVKANLEDAKSRKNHSPKLISRKKNLCGRKIFEFSTLCLRNKKTFLPYKQPWFLFPGWLSHKKFFHYNNLYCIRSIINASLSLVSLLVMPLDDSGQFRGQSTKEVIQKVLLIQASSAKPV